MKFDYARAAALFDIVQKVANVGPRYTNIAAEAMAELNEMNDALAEEQKKRSAKPVVPPGQPSPETPVPSKPVDHADGVRRDPTLFRDGDDRGPVVERKL